jgi:phenylpropionate dioxygenase-like ring-hydroxylating dioxygenase large terminal subunit
MAVDNPKIAGGKARSPSVRWPDLVAKDRIRISDELGKEVNEYRGSRLIAASRYTDPAFFELEKRRMWPHVWQFAARDEDVPKPGDYVVYENVGRSYLVVRQDDGSVLSFHNVCLHRGTKLRVKGGSTTSFRCPFHGFEWRTDGSVCNVPCRWDFSALRDSEIALPRAAVARWGGYIFVREALDGPTIEEYLDPLTTHFERWPHNNRTTVAWVGKVFPANWKVTAEAFMESFHTILKKTDFTAYITTT